MIRFEEDKVRKKADDLRHVEEEELAQLLASRTGYPYINLHIIPINLDALRVIDEPSARAAKIAAFHQVDKKLDVAILTPKTEETLAIIEQLKQKGYNVEVHIGSSRGLEHAWEMYKDLSYAKESTGGSLEISTDDIQKYLTTIKHVDDVKKYVSESLTNAKGYRISHILEIMLAGAIVSHSSDIHIEPEETYIRLRYRLDGVLSNVMVFEKETYRLLLSRIKLLSGLKLNINSDAQDGRFSVKIEGQDIEIRTSVLPGSYGESIVLRLLDPKSISVPLEELGISPKLLDILLREIKKPNGMILTTGPTGSGKTTTLYAFLKKIHTPDVKIITIEDPVEYHLPGVVQTQVEAEKGYTFLQGLRSALRQDPDVIMVGEIRDRETAEIAVNSALTGHLVFSTLHTNNAAGAFPRLGDLGVNPKVLTSAVNISLAQRLVRKLCESCKKEVAVEGEIKEKLDVILHGIHDVAMQTEARRMWQAVGCEKCNKSGYKGRVGIYEAILIDKEIEAILPNYPSDREIQAAAAHQGILTLQQDGVLKILKGITSLEELERVVDLTDR